MFDRAIYATDAGAAILKGMVMAATVTLLDVEFWKAIIIAVVSATLTGLFGLVTAWVAVRETRQTRARIEDVARRVNADRRAGEQDAGGERAG